MLSKASPALAIATSVDQAPRYACELADYAAEGLAMCENGLIKGVNASFVSLIGQSQCRMLNRPLHSFVSDDSQDRFRAMVPNAPCEVQLKASNELVPVEITMQVVPDHVNQRVYAVQDIRSRKELEARFRYLAEHDGLTGLANRSALHARLADLIERAWHIDKQLSVFSIDIDGFKDINDVFGNAAGDAILVETTARLLQEAGDDALVARIGSDDFILVSGSCGTAAATQLAERLMTAMAEYCVLGDRKVKVGLSIGIAVYPSHGAGEEKLLSNANMALDRAKAEGGATYCFYNTHTDLILRERRALAQDLTLALQSGELELYFQPQGLVPSLACTGFEALVRWRHPGRGLISPAEFVTIAEENGLIHDLGLWVFRRACEEAAKWRNPLDIAVNLSPLQFQQSDLPDQLSALLSETGLPPERLELEITETALIKDFDRGISMLRRLKALGVRIAMDDFGTGWSSLATLQAFPFDKLKIDKTFVEKIGRHDQAEMIIRAVLGLCRSLQIPVLAEGVETQEQLEFLHREGCTALQGYLLARPGPIEAFDDLVSGNRAFAFSD